jgi:poly(A) polymerase
MRIMDTVRLAGGEARVVGGAVRDVLLARAIGDIDLAVNLPPERVMELLAQQHIKAVPTGIAHGTVTAVIDRIGYELTALRRDVETDGRHAQVAFTDDWREDAARRDFTFNALYVDTDGKLTDYFDGAADAAAGRVRFIGHAHARIREDVLRILRFFRFYAWFGRGEPDAEGLAACRELGELMPRLSAERVAREVMKLLAASNPMPAWQLMIDNGVLRHFLIEATGITRLKVLLDAEHVYGEPSAPITRLGALLPQDKGVATAVAARLKLSRRDTELLAVLAVLPNKLCGKLTPLPLRRLLYTQGVGACRAAILIHGEAIAEALAVIDAWENPIFPLRGDDIVALGVATGPQVGVILRAVEEWWIAGDFRASRALCLTYAQMYWKS